MTAAIESIGGLRFGALEASSLGAGNPIITPPTAYPTVAAPSFSQMLLSGLDKVNDKITSADTLVTRFALGEEIPMHQVTIALEQARLSLEFAMQVRGRLLEGYREIMNMQL